MHAGAFNVRKKANLQFNFAMYVAERDVANVPVGTVRNAGKRSRARVHSAPAEVIAATNYTN